MKFKLTVLLATVVVTMGLLLGTSVAQQNLTIGGTVTGLEGSGLVLQNNGSDDLSIDADGEFTFVTPLTRNDPYLVTVFTQPEGQFCGVENGSGKVDDDPVTNVAVSCVSGNLDDTWYEGKIRPKNTRGWLTKNDGTLVRVEPSLQYFFKVCNERIISDCGGVEYNVVLAIADFDGDGIFKADEVFNIFLATCGPSETSFVAELEITGEFVDNDAATVEVFNQAANGQVLGVNNRLLSLGCGWTADGSGTALDPDITGQTCRFLAKRIDENELPFTPQDLVDEGVINDVSDLDCSSTVVANAQPKGGNVVIPFTLTLNGSNSTPAGGTFAWALTDIPEGSAATLSDPAIANPTFTMDVAGIYTVELTYTVGTESDTDTFDTRAFNPVVANAGQNQAVFKDELVTLDGSLSSPSGGTFSWVFTDIPSASDAILLGADTANPTFIADKDGDYIVVLIYTVGPDSATDEVLVVAADQPPI